MQTSFFWYQASSLRPSEKFLQRAELYGAEILWQPVEVQVWRHLNTAQLQETAKPWEFCLRTACFLLTNFKNHIYTYTNMCVYVYIFIYTHICISIYNSRCATHQPWADKGLLTCAVPCLEEATDRTEDETNIK